MQDLALQVRRVDDVHVDDAERADAGGREVQRGGLSRARRRRAAAPSTLEQLLLAGLADLGQEDVAVVPVALLGVSDRGRDPVAAFVLPAAEAAGHRHDVGVAELLERLGRERRAGAARAVDDDRRVLVGELGLDLALEVAAGDEHRAGDRALLVLVLLADVEERRRRRAAASASAGAISRIVCLGLGEQLAEAGHGGSFPGQCPVGNATAEVGYSQG